MRPTRKLRGLAGLLAPLVLCACTEAAPCGERVEAAPAPSASAGIQPGPEADSVEVLLQQMTLRQKVGQLFMVRPDALDPSLPQEEIDDETAEGVCRMTDAMRQSLEQYPVGGICQFGKNITDPQQIAAFNGELQEASTLPLLITVDEEGGRVARLANNDAFDLPRYESALAVGNTGDPEAARQMGRTIGAYLRDYGFTMDFAPVADVWTNPENTVIGDRAFSREAHTAAVMAEAMAQGLREEGILPTYKHFPGHGDTAQDSHNGLASTNRTEDEMRECEWLPFLRKVQPTQNMARAIMVGHIATPALGETGIPASLSHRMVTDVLRGQLLAGEEVLVVTDSLAMGAITQQYTPAQASVQALQAGCDILLMPDGLAEAFEGVVAAVEEGTITQTRLDESVRRILRYKQQYAGLQVTAEQ